VCRTLYVSSHDLELGIARAVTAIIHHNLEPLMGQKDYTTLPKGWNGRTPNKDQNVCARSCDWGQPCFEWNLMDYIKTHRNLSSPWEFEDST